MTCVSPDAGRNACLAVSSNTSSHISRGPNTVSRRANNPDASSIDLVHSIAWARSDELKTRVNLFVITLMVKVNLNASGRCAKHSAWVHWLDIWVKLVIAEIRLSVTLVIKWVSIFL